MDEMRFEYYLNRYKDLPEAVAYLQAIEGHSLFIKDKLLEMLSSLSLLPENLRDERAIQHVKYGVLRRNLMIWHSFHTLWNTAHPRRKKPLTSDEQYELNRDLNMIYVNL